MQSYNNALSDRKFCRWLSANISRVVVITSNCRDAKLLALSRIRNWFLDSSIVTFWKNYRVVSGHRHIVSTTHLCRIITLHFGVNKASVITGTMFKPLYMDHILHWYSSSSTCFSWKAGKCSPSGIYWSFEENKQEDLTPLSKLLRTMEFN